MAEIKSTLELVMERTRHLTMSEEDKRKQAAKEFKEAVNRLALKYLDGQINLDRFQAEFSRLEAGASGKTEAAAEIGRRIDPAADNTLLLDLIKHGLGFDISGIEAILHQFQRDGSIAKRPGRSSASRPICWKKAYSAAPWFPTWRRIRAGQRGTRKCLRLSGRSLTRKSRNSSR